MRLAKRSQGWWAGLLVLTLLFLPSVLSAQAYLYTDAGRVMYTEHIQQNPVKPITRGGADWNIFARVPQYFYPFDEWNITHKFSLGLEF